MYDIFISYHRTCASQTARTLQSKLKEHGYTVYLD